MNDKYKNDFIHAGCLAGQVREYGKSLIQPGISYSEVINKIYQKIADLEAIPAFPPQIALNDVAAHFLPMPGEDIIFSNQIVKLDIGVCCNGAIGDCAVTIDLSGQHQALINATEEALLAAERIIKVGLPIRQIGKTIEETINSYPNFKPIKNLAGHGLGRYRVHTPPCIPNYDDNSKNTLKPGMTFAIEPFCTDGYGLIYELGEATIFSLIKERPGRSPISRKLMQKIKTFQGLPFGIRDFQSTELSPIDIFKGLKELMSLNIIEGYPPLVEKNRGLVAQAENSVLIDLEGNVHITTRL